MANARHDDKTNQNARDNVRRLGEQTAEETRRMGETAAEAGQQLARVGAEVMQRHAEAVQTMLRSGVEIATSVMGQSTDHFGRTFGLSGDEAHKAAERSTHSAVSILQSTSAAAQAMSSISQEYFGFLRSQIERGMKNIDELSRCRTPQDLAAVQTEFVRETIQNTMHSSRRIADMSVKLADETTKQMERPAA